jgi:hypothetical protein
VVDDLGHLIDIYFTCGKPKQKFMFDKGICVQVWIDDCPEAIVPRQMLNTWGERINYDEVETQTNNRGEFYGARYKTTKQHIKADGEAYS